MKDWMPPFGNLNSLKPPEEDDPIGLTGDWRSLEGLQAIYRNPKLPLKTRFEAMKTSAPYEYPRLAVTAVVSENDFATLLDQRIAKLKQIEQQKLIEATPIKENGGNADARLPPPIPDRRFRRRF